MIEQKKKKKTTGEQQGKTFIWKMWTEYLRVLTYELKLGRVPNLGEHTGYWVDIPENYTLKNRINLALEQRLLQTHPNKA